MLRKKAAHFLCDAGLQSSGKLHNRFSRSLCLSYCSKMPPNQRRPKKYWPPKAPGEKAEHMDLPCSLGLMEIRFSRNHSVFLSPLSSLSFSFLSPLWIRQLSLSTGLYWDYLFFSIGFQAQPSTSGQILALSNHWGLVKLGQGSLDYFPGPFEHTSLPGPPQSLKALFCTFSPLLSLGHS